MNVDVVAIVVKGLAYLAMLQGAGTVLFVAVFGRQLERSREAIRRLGILSALVAAAAVIGVHVLEAARMTGEFSGVFEGHLQARVMRSSMAVATGLRLSGLGVLFAAMATTTSNRIAPALAGAALVTTSFALVGHTVSHEPRWVLASLLEAHLLIGSFWVGSIACLFLVVLRESRENAHDVVDRFSQVAVWLVPVLAAAGLAMAWRLTGGEYSLADAYAVALTGKFILFGIALGFAALNRWRLGPALSVGSTVAGTRLRASLVAEYVILIALIALTATMTSLFSPGA